MITTVSYDSRSNKIKIRRKIEVKNYKTITNKWETTNDTKYVQKDINSNEKTPCHAAYRAKPTNWG